MFWKVGSGPRYWWRLPIRSVPSADGRMIEPRLTISHVLDDGWLRCTVLKSNGIADFVPTLDVYLGGNSSCHTHGSYSTWLCTSYKTCLTIASFMQVLRNLQANHSSQFIVILISPTPTIQDRIVNEDNRFKDKEKTLSVDVVCEKLYKMIATYQYESSAICIGSCPSLGAKACGLGSLLHAMIICFKNLVQVVEDIIYLCRFARSSLSHDDDNLILCNSIQQSFSVRKDWQKFSYLLRFFSWAVRWSSFIFCRSISAAFLGSTGS